MSDIQTEDVTLSHNQSLHKCPPSLSDVFVIEHIRKIVNVSLYTLYFYSSCILLFMNFVYNIISLLSRRLQWTNLNSVQEMYFEKLHSDKVNAKLLEI